MGTKIYIRKTVLYTYSFFFEYLSNRIPTVLRKTTQENYHIIPSTYLFSKMKIRLFVLQLISHNYCFLSNNYSNTWICKSLLKKKLTLWLTDVVENSEYFKSLEIRFLNWIEKSVDGLFIFQLKCGFVITGDSPPRLFSQQIKILNTC